MGVTIFVSITRLRLRSWRFLPAFLIHTWRTIHQTKRADGYRAGWLLADRKMAYWTMTLWRDQAAMKAYMASGAHARAMPHLLHWCDEASVVHWTQAGDAAPDWHEADRRMRSEGRPSKVRHPGSHHRDQSYPPPRTTGAVPIMPPR